MEEHFEKIEELINDDNKIVTVASYASIANIPFQESQKVIDKYVEINKGSKEIYLTYILSGIKKDSQKNLVVQVNDETLDNEKQLFMNEPAVIVYSIQKSKCIDYNIISLVKPDSHVVESTLIGAIVGKNCAKRCLRKKVLPTLPAPAIKGKSTVFFKPNSSVKPDVKSEEKINDKNDTSQESAKFKQASSKGGIANMFNKVAQMKTSDTKEKTETKPKPTGGFTNFFTKEPSKDTLSKDLDKREIKEGKNTGSKSENTNGSDQRSKQNKAGSDLFDSDKDEDILKDLNIHNEKLVDIKTEKKCEKTKSIRNRNTASQKKKREKNDVGNDKAAKKRKHIIVEDSDSDDIFGSEKSDNEENDVKENLDEEPESTKPEAKPVLPKNKRRKAVKRTYEDEEGFIVTQTEYVYETASEDENEANSKMTKEEESKPKLEKKSSNSEPEVSPNKASKSKKGAKKAPPGNQPTLMSFFKKK